MHSVGGHRVEVAWGTIYPIQFELHIFPINAECAVVKVEFVAEWPDMLLPFPPNDEISTIGEAVFQRIQWRRHDIVLRSKQISSQTMAKGNKKGVHQMQPRPLCHQRKLMNLLVLPRLL